VAKFEKGGRFLILLSSDHQAPLARVQMQGMGQKHWLQTMSRAGNTILEKDGSELPCWPCGGCTQGLVYDGPITVGMTAAKEVARPLV
jgi:hypothetical protein